MSSRPVALGRANLLERSLLIVTAVLVALGVLFVCSAAAPTSIANNGSVWGFIARDLLQVVLGCLGFVIAARLPARTIARWSVPALWLSIVLLVAVKAVGTTTSGGRRWLTLGVLSVQPSELFTLCACLYLAMVVARTETATREWSKILRQLVPILVGVILVAIEPDMGTTSVVVLVSLATLWLAGLPPRAVGLTVVLTALIGLVFALIEPYRRARLMALFGGSGHSSYQVLQAKIGLGAGQISGLGFGHGREKWGLLPNPHTDFIFATIGEEGGFIAAVILLGLFVWLLTLGMRAARRAPDRSMQLFAAGITVWFGIEVFVNVASVVGVFPVTGVPLPLISYGGTSLVITLGALGLLVNVARATTLRRREPASATMSAVRPSSTTTTRPSRASGTYDARGRREN